VRGVVWYRALRGGVGRKGGGWDARRCKRRVWQRGVRRARSTGRVWPRVQPHRGRARIPRDAASGRLPVRGGCECDAHRSLGHGSLIYGPAFRPPCPPVCLGGHAISPPLAAQNSHPHLASSAVALLKSDSRFPLSSPPLFTAAPPAVAAAPHASPRGSGPVTPPSSPPPPQVLRLPMGGYPDSLSRPQRTPILHQRSRRPRRHSHRRRAPRRYRGRRRRGDARRIAHDDEGAVSGGAETSNDA
jgi:hypothetical protein